MRDSRCRRRTLYSGIYWGGLNISTYENVHFTIGTGYIAIGDGAA